MCVSVPIVGNPAASEETEAQETECFGLKPHRPPTPPPPSVSYCFLYGKEASETLEDM